MADQDLLRALDETKLGAAALGLCIARVLAESNPTIQQQFLDAAEKMEHHLSQNNRTAAAQILAFFRLGLARPEDNTLLTPND